VLFRSEVCEWDYHIKTEEVDRHPNCITIGLLPLSADYISDKQLQEFKNYLNKKVEITGIMKSTKWGVKGKDCEMVQIGCERDIEMVTKLI
jgi:hypothetical protein